MAQDGGVDPHNISVALGFLDRCQRRLTSSCISVLAPHRGFDPRPPGSKPGVLPLHQSGSSRYQIGAQRSGSDLDEEEGGCGCVVFAALSQTAETERSRLLLTW